MNIQFLLLKPHVSSVTVAHIQTHMLVHNAFHANVVVLQRICLLLHVTCVILVIVPKLLGPRDVLHVLRGPMQIHWVMSAVHFAYQVLGSVVLDDVVSTRQFNRIGS